jgi:CPA1 family monovalent cation:H+ antiporter
MSATTQMAVGLSWEFIGFLANSLIFLLVGLEVRAIQVAEFWEITALAIGVTLFSRVVVIGFFSWGANWINHRLVIPLSWQIMLIWGGLRGSLSLAMALSLPVFLASGAVFPDRSKILVMTFGLIMFNLLVQGLTIEPLMKLLKLEQRPSPELRRYELYRGQVLTAQAVRRRLEELYNRNLLSEEAANLLQEEYTAREKAATAELHRLQLNNRQMKAEQMQLARQRLRQVEKSTATDLYNQGVISEEVMRELRANIDAQINQPENALNQPENPSPQIGPDKSGDSTEVEISPPQRPSELL